MYFRFLNKCTTSRKCFSIVTFIFFKHKNFVFVLTIVLSYRISPSDVELKMVSRINSFQSVVFKFKMSAYENTARTLARNGFTLSQTSRWPTDHSTRPPSQDPERHHILVVTPTSWSGYRYIRDLLSGEKQQLVTPCIPEETLDCLYPP